MFLPIGDAPNSRGVPVATWLLIAANVAVYLLVSVPLGARRADLRDPALREYVEVVWRATGERLAPRQIVQHTSAYDLFTFRHGYRPSAPEPLDLLTCMFLHGGPMHLFGNMLFLWIYGDNVERRLGGPAYVAWYLVTGVAGTLSHALFFPASPMPLVGASGAISGVLGFYFVWFPRNSVRMLAFLPPFLMDVFEVPARVVLGLYLVADNLLPFLVAGEGGVAHGAHIGGFLAGTLVAWVIDRRGLARPAAVPVARAGREPADPRGLLAQGRAAEAAEAYFAVPPARATGILAPAEAVALASWLRQTGQPDAALVVLRRTLRGARGGAGLAEVAALTGLVLAEDHGEPTAAYQYLLTALDLGPRPETVPVVRRALAQIEASQKRQIGHLRRPPY